MITQRLRWHMMIYRSISRDWMIMNCSPRKTSSGKSRRNRREECGLYLFKKREENKRLKKPEKRPLSMSQAQRRFFLVYMAVTLSLTLGGIPVLAADDPLSVVNNLSDFVFSLIRAIGLILLGFGIVQIGLSLKSQDPSQRANGFLTLAGGVVITFAKEILNLITG